MLEWINSKAEFDEIRKKNGEFLALFFYGDFSDSARRALQEIEDFKKNNEKISIYGVDVSRVKGIHHEFNVKKVPTVLVIQKGKEIEKIEGVQSAQFYERSFNHANPVFKKSKKGNDSVAPRVVVYSTPTCPACNSAKAYFRRKGVRFRDIDVSRDQQAAESLVRRSGQMAVPQIDINGQLIVGFDQARIDRLLFN